MVAGEESSVSAPPLHIEKAVVDVIFFQNGLLKANISWNVANGETYRVQDLY